MHKICCFLFPFLGFIYYYCFFISVVCDPARTESDRWYIMWSWPTKNHGFRTTRGESGSGLGSCYCGHIEFSGITTRQKNMALKERKKSKAEILSSCVCKTEPSHRLKWFIFDYVFSFFLLNFQRFGNQVSWNPFSRNLRVSSIHLCKLWIWDLCLYCTCRDLFPRQACVHFKGIRGAYRSSSVPLCLWGRQEIMRHILSAKRAVRCSDPSQIQKIWGSADIPGKQTRRCCISHPSRPLLSN